jgi:hypothetical protein
MVKRPEDAGLVGRRGTPGNYFREQAKLRCYLDKSYLVNLGNDKGYRFIGWQKPELKYIESGNL